MRKKVLLKDIVKAVNGKVLHQGDCDYVRWVVSSGLMSDVLTTVEEEILLLSSLTTTQVVRTADMVGAHAILLACGKPISPDTVALAADLDITIISCEMPVFETGHYLSSLFFEE
ncbi:MAG: hypothetical protein PF637_01650 [Spirochaetes bacterium]|jgi:hypothetical protein|nr:hypothetical protein [Spirochaetota bacterium]